MKLAPREHGAWGQLGFPLATALAVVHAGPAPFLAAAAALAFFLAHEPALVASGRRGARAREQSGRLALRALCGLIAAGATLGACGLWLAPPPARLGAAGAVALGALLAAAVALKMEKTLPGELVAAAAMTSAGFVVALAGGVRFRLAGEIWASWLLGFSAAVVPVRAIVVEHRTRASSAAARIAAPLVIAVAGGLLAATRALEPGLVCSAAPLFAAGLLLAVRPPSMKQLSRAGWMLMLAGALTSALMAAAAHRSGPGALLPDNSTSPSPEAQRPHRLHPVRPRSFLVAGAGFEPATFGL